MKDRFTAKLAFFLSLGFWIPLFNIGLSIVAVYYSIRALRLIHTGKNEGLAYAISALIISLTTLIGSLIFAFVYSFRQLTCEAIVAI